MKINKHTAIATTKALLVPYEARHVLTYHGWMQDPDIQQATASEPLTLQEEYENQQSWRLAHDKLTFIVCAPQPRLLSSSSQDNANGVMTAGGEDADALMRGDVNFFLHVFQDDDDDEDENAHAGWLTGEVDVMIASQEHRGHGLGRAAVCALLVYLHRHLDRVLREHDDDSGDAAEGAAAAAAAGPSILKGLMVKIQEANAASRALFRKLGFVQQGEVNYFGEVLMTMKWDELTRQSWWEGAVSEFREIEYQNSV